MMILWYKKWIVAVVVGIRRALCEQQHHGRVCGRPFFVVILALFVLAARRLYSY
jgi:hypothetical protein